MHVDPTMINKSELTADGTGITVTFYGSTGSRREASVKARQLLRGNNRQGRLAFAYSAITGETHDGRVIATYGYAIVDPHARLRAQLSEDIQNR